MKFKVEKYAITRSIKGPSQLAQKCCDNRLPLLNFLLGIMKIWNIHQNEKEKTK